MEEQGLDALEALRHAERDILQRLQASSPEQLMRPEPVDPLAEQAHIGISGVPEGPRGYLRLHPQDFIVEEVGPDGTVATIDPEPRPTLSSAPGSVLFADVVKIGIGTLEAVAHLAAGLGISPGNIKYAGMKDTLAVTSQRMSFQKVDVSALWERRFSQLFIKPKRRGEGLVRVGELRGNRFTILVRTETPMDEAALTAAIGRLREDGFANFYGPQRFGSRLLNAYLGLLLCRGEEREAVRVYLTAPGPFDAPLHRSMRERAAACFGRWDDMGKVFDELPYSFRRERTMIAALQKQPDRWGQAIRAIPDQARFWIYGYASFLVNQVLSLGFTQGTEIPDPLPLPLEGQRAHALYRPLLERDGTTSHADSLRRYWFFVDKPRVIQPWIYPEVHRVAATPVGAALSFTLPRAAYATTLLLFVFRTYTGQPVPSWVRRDAIDVRDVLGMGSVAPALERLGPIGTPSSETTESSE